MKRTLEMALAASVSAILKNLKEEDR